MTFANAKRIAQTKTLQEHLLPSNSLCEQTLRSWYQFSPLRSQSGMPPMWATDLRVKAPESLIETGGFIILADESLQHSRYLDTAAQVCQAQAFDVRK